MSTTLSSLSEQTTHSGREQIKHVRVGLSAFSSRPQVWALVVLAEPIPVPSEKASFPWLARVFVQGYRWFHVHVHVKLPARQDAHPQAPWIFGGSTIALFWNGKYLYVNGTNLLELELDLT
jgi:hypothetical protein